MRCKSFFIMMKWKYATLWGVMLESTRLTCIIIPWQILHKVMCNPATGSCKSQRCFYTYGQNKILAPIFNDVQKLANRYEFDINGTPTEMFGEVVSCLGDTEGQHQWGGFKVQVGWAHQKCRSYLCTFNSMQVNFRGSLFIERTLEQYCNHCDDIESAPTPAAVKDLSTTYGIVERSLLSKLSQFDIVKQLPEDIMHVLLEGSVQYEVRHILQHFIDNGYFTLKQLNNALNHLSLGYHDERNRPPPLRETIFTGQDRYKMKQTAEQARIFLKYFPFCLKGFVEYGNPYYQLLLKIISTVSTCFSPVISEETIQELENSIEAHLNLFKELFPTVNITPKMHYMVHLPNQIRQLGPLVRHCCLRFEARHRYFKDLAPQQNFKNICLSLGERCQFDDCADCEIENPIQHPLFQRKRKLDPTKRVVNEARTTILDKIADARLFVKPDGFHTVFSAKWIKLYGTKL